MVKGISTSKLEEIAKVVAEEFGISVWFAEVVGRRWSYLAGSVISEPLPSVRFMLDEKLGLVVETDDEKLAKTVFDYVRKLIR